MYNNKLLDRYNNRNVKENEQINMMKQQQEFKRLEKLNDLDKSQIRDTLIKPIKITKPNQNEINERINQLQPQYDKKYIESNYWQKRTNQPYKVILKNEDFTKSFKKKEDLIVHKVTNADKIGTMDDFNKLQKNLEKHNNELKVIYSTSKEVENKQKFEYNNKAKFRVKYDPKSQEELKEDHMDYYKKEQEKLEKDTEQFDSMLAILEGEQEGEQEGGEQEEKQEKIKPKLISRDMPQENIQKQENTIRVVAKVATIIKEQQVQAPTIKVADDVKSKYKSRMN